MKRLGFFLAGFLIGMVLLFLKRDVIMTETWIWGAQAVITLSDSSLAGRELLFLVGIKRMKLVILIAASAMFRFGMAALYFLIFSMGFSFGLYVTSAIIFYGKKGLILSFVSLLPQALFYVPGFLLLLKNWNHIYRTMGSGTLKYERKFGNCKVEIQFILIQFFIALGVVIIGIFLESYVNPIVIKKLINIL